MRGAVYARRERGATEYYDLRVDPYQLHNALGPSDTAYPPPALATRDIMSSVWTNSTVAGWTAP
jgi:hypothetical protein